MDIETMLDFITNEALPESAEELDITYGCRIVKLVGLSNINSEQCGFSVFKNYGDHVGELNLNIVVGVPDTYPILDNNIHAADMVLCTNAAEGCVDYAINREQFPHCLYWDEDGDEILIAEDDGGGEDFYGLFARSYWIPVKVLEHDFDFEFILVSFCVYSSLNDANRFYNSQVQRIKAEFY